MPLPITSVRATPGGRWLTQLDREGILSAIAIEGFQELGTALESARKRRNPVESVVAAYLEFAASSPALYKAMFSLSLNVPFGKETNPPTLRFAFS